MLLQTGLPVPEENIKRKNGININRIYDYVVFKNLIISMKNVTYHMKFLYSSLTIKACEHA